MSLKFSPCGRLSLLRFARNCKQRSSLGTKISAQHSNPSQNTSPYHFIFKFVNFDFSFLWERKGFYLQSVVPSSPKPSPTPLHVQGGDTALLAQSVANLNLRFQDTGLGK